LHCVCAEKRGRKSIKKRVTRGELKCRREKDKRVVGVLGRNLLKRQQQTLGHYDLVLPCGRQLEKR